MTESDAWRRVSWLLTAKCLGHAAMPFDCTPRTKAAAILPDRSGSSEKYSKLRPQSGLRLMQRPGASSVPTFWTAASWPMAAPTRSSSSSSQVLAMVTAVGKHVAGSEPESPRWSACSPAWWRTPDGPSENSICGMPAFSSGQVPKGVAPCSRTHFSSSVSLAMMSARLMRPPPGGPYR